MFLDKLDADVKHLLDLTSFGLMTFLGLDKLLFNFASVGKIGTDIMLFISAFASMVWLVIRSFNAILDLRKRIKTEKDENQ